MTMIRRNRIPSLFAFAVFVVLFGRTDGAATQEQAQARAIFLGTPTVVHFDISPPLRTLAALAQPQEPREEQERDEERKTGLEGPLGPQDADARVQSEVGGGEIPSPSTSYDAISNLCNCSPPDPNGAVGPIHYVTMVNLHFAVYAKSNNALLLGPLANNTLWAGFGGACQAQNAGDPVVLYDHFADRWLLTQFTSAGPTYYNCVALSQTGDPTGSYYRWAFSTGSNFPDYPKYGIWRDGYYISTREFLNGSTFVGAGAYAVNRAQMIAGNPNPVMLHFNVPPTTPYLPGDGLLPADIDGPTLPPLNAPELFIGSQDNGGPYGAPYDALNLWRFHADFNIPANSTFVGPIVIPVAAFDSILDLCGGTRNCVPQPGTANRLDHLGYRQRPLHRAAYRNFGPYESIVTNQSVDVAAISGIRWWEIRDPNGFGILYQESTYAPAGGVHRWMGSIAQDHAGNMALGFSASSASMFPSIMYTGRLVTDSLGTMGQGEGVIVNGTGSQTGSQRWGDYSAMSVDPSDDCKFWFTSEYIPTTSSNGWRTRIGAFKFPQCEGRRPQGDRDGDFKTDRNIFRPSTGTWYSYLSANGLSTATNWGTSTDVDVMADYDGDGRVDVAVWRPSIGTWFIILTSTGGVRIDTWGTLGDIPMGSDIDQDGIADLVIFRPSTGSWYAKRSTGGTGSASWGASGDYPLLGDRDGDKLRDLIAYRPTAGVWYFFLSGGGTTFVPWGTSGDIPVVGDFDGDGIVDPTVFRPSAGQWWVNKSTGGTLVVGWGTTGDIPISGDFDGDGKSDFTIWRPSTGTWYTQYAAGGSIGVTWGIDGDKAVGRAPGT